MEVQGGAEMRRIHIIYFLSRRGRIEHPHLVRVHHLSRNGVRLRDVKRWLSELRGKDMPESFAWSYKRKYKTGYVWQDLLDEDLITPISDSEYVLKGSEITSTTSFNNDLMSGEKKNSKQKEATLEDEAKGQKNSSKERNGRHPQSKIDVSTNTPCEIEEESPPFSSETSTLTDDSIKFEEDKALNDTTKQETDEHGNKFDNNSSVFYSSLLNKKRKKKRNGVNVEKESTPAASSTSSENSSFMRSKSYSSGASHMFRNLITCRAVDTNDSAMVMINRRNKASFSIPTGERCSNSSEIVKREKLGGSERIFGTPWNQQQHSGRKSCDGVMDARKNKKSEFSNEKTANLVNRPNCSQCGKPFKPEKLPTHMKSCRGMKALAKGASPATSATTAEKTPQTTMNSSHQDSFFGHYLTTN